MFLLRLRQLWAAALMVALATPVWAVEEREGGAAVSREEVEDLREDLDQTRERLDAAIDMLEAQDAGESRQRVHIGGYGELHYNNLEDENGDEAKKEIDFHRFVLFFGYDFTPDIRLVSEVELEHALAGEGEEGEVELEQAYLEFDLNDQHRARGGLFLVPVGIINPTHEPPTFYGVERNRVENVIIPTTWWESGAALNGSLGGGMSYDLAMHSGLAVDPMTFEIRGGRQKSSEADAEDPAYTAGLRWRGLPGLEVGGALQYQRDITQSMGTDEAPALLSEAHVDYQRAGLGLRALYARWDIDGDEAEAVGADEQYGWYVEPSVRPCERVGLFVRYSEWDTTAGDNDESKIEETSLGVNYWPHPQVVLKADYQWQTVNADDSEVNGFNLGIGYQF